MLGRDPTLYHTMGLFFATFTYSLAALLWVDRLGSGRVPGLTVGVVAALLVASLLAFAKLVQSFNNLPIQNVLQAIGEKGRAVIRAMFVRIDNGGGNHEQADALSDLGPATQTLGYDGDPRAITRLDIDALVRLAESADAVIVVDCGVGETLIDSMTVLRVHGATRPLPEPELRAAVHLDIVRTFEQDPKYAIRLLVDIAIRALSPAINDPTTAVQALDQIEDLLRRLGRRELDAGRAYDVGGQLRLVFPTPTWEDYLALSFDEIRQYGATSVQVARRMRSALVGLAETVRIEERREAVRLYLDHLNLSVARSVFDDRDQAAAMEEDRQGLGLSRKKRQAPPLSV
jgi:uncharacterized membrane protein